MPRRTDIRSILIIGSGPIRIGQACEFDYSGSQACRVLREAGYRVILVNSNPATIMTDPVWADATYIEPLDADTVAQIIERERPDALLPTLGGQTALNLAVELSQAGILDRYGVELIGADFDAILRAEDREAFRSLMIANGLDVLEGVVIGSLDDLPTGLAPAVVRPGFTLGGTGGGLARTEEELRVLVGNGLAASPIGEVLVEESVEGWYEFELEVMADTAGSCIVVCSIENIEPVGVHTGDSWTVAPQQTLSDPEYQRMRDAAFACMRAVGVATGGANVQFAYEPVSGRLKIIEMNPRASRSSALASKATGFPIAKLAALLAVGFNLEELPNDITGKTTAAFEPALDYVAVKAPRFDFAKFGIDRPVLGTQMQAVGETLGLGRTFSEAMLKALEGLEGSFEMPDFSGAHPYFQAELEAIDDAESELMVTKDITRAKRLGLPDSFISRALGIPCQDVREVRPTPGKLAVDSCAAEFEARTPYFYLSYEAAELVPEPKHSKSVLILGSGPNRIGQGIEFDYSCVHAAHAFADLGYEVVMLNSNPETVSTDYDTSHRLYLEPVTLERVLDVCQLEAPEGVVVTLGGQTPLALAAALADAGVPLIGDPSEAITLTEDRGRFGKLLDELGLEAPAWGRASDYEGATVVADRIGYPVIVRPDFVLGGQGMHVAYTPDDLDITGPVLIDRFIAGAIELDVEILADGHDAWVAGIIEQIEPTGVHSGDSACVIPAPSVTADIHSQIDEIARLLTPELGIRGLLNLQVAIDRDHIYVLEANPRASRTVPFLSKAIGLPLVGWACRLMLGQSLEDIGHPNRAEPARAWAKEAIFPTDRFPGCDERGPEMRSTGEVMAGGATPAVAYTRALRAAGRSTRPGSIGPTLQELAGPTMLKKSA